MKLINIIVTLVFLLFNSTTFAANTDLDPIIKANRMIGTVTFENTTTPGLYDVLVAVPTKHFTKTKIDLSATIHVLINRNPIQGASTLLKMDGSPTSTINKYQTVKCQYKLDPIDTLASKTCSCGFGCNSVGVCDNQSLVGSCACNQPASIARISNIRINPGDEVTVFLRAAPNSLPESLTEDDKRVIIFK